MKTFFDGLHFCGFVRRFAITRGLTVAALIALAIAPGAFAAETNSIVTAQPPCCRAVEGAGDYTDRSLYQLESVWTSDVGKEIRLGVLRGRVQIVAMFFASCEFTCPITVHDLKSIQAAMPESLRERVDFLLVTFDSERDTPAALAAYRDKMKLEPKHWTLLRGKSDDVRELAALLGVNFKRDPRGQFAHSNLITTLNEKGEIIHQLPGMNHDAKAFVRELEKLLGSGR